MFSASRLMVLGLADREMLRYRVAMKQPLGADMSASPRRVNVAAMVQ